MAKEFRYYNKGIKRKKDIYAWTTKILKQIGDYYEIYGYILKGELTEAYYLFKGAINKIIIYNYENLGYLIQKNQAEYGEDVINSDLFRGIFGETRPEGPRREPPQKPGEREPEPKYYYGRTKEGKRQKGRYEIVFIKGRAQDRLRSNKTGRFLKFSGKLKTKIKKRGKIKNMEE